MTTAPTFDFDVRLSAIEQVHTATGFMTSTHVVDGMLDRIGWPQPGATLLDPSCGDGSFLAQAIARLPAPIDDVDALRCVEGWEFHAGAVALARERIADLLVSRGWTAAVAIDAARKVVVEGDFLTEASAWRRFTYIMGNPPYLRYANWPEFLQEQYRAVVPDWAIGDLQHAFLEKCTRFLAPGGLIGFVTADRWIQNEGSAALRLKIGAILGIRHIERLDASTSFYRAKTRRKGAAPRIHPISVFLGHAGAGTRELGEAPICPDDGLQAPEAGTTLADIATVRIAPWLGKEGVFVVPVEQAATLTGGEFLPAVDTDDIDPHTDELREPRRVALVTRRDQEPTGPVKAHLLANRDKMSAKAPVWWVPPESITLKLDRPSLLIPRIARRIRVVRLPAGVLPINHNLQIVQGGAVELDELEAILKSAECHAWIERNAPRLEGGFYSITTGLLRRMPVRWTRDAQKAA